MCTGGHTAEMLALLRGFDLQRYAPRTYYVAATDSMSSQKAHTFESAIAADFKGSGVTTSSETVSSIHEIKNNTSNTQRNKLRHRKAATEKTPIMQHHPPTPAYSITTIPRSREVGQSFITSALTTTIALFHAVTAVLKQRPDVVLCNGPGTCIPVCIAAVLVRLLGIGHGRIIYVESIARVYRLSLSGKILYHTRIADAFFVQWKELQELYPRSVFAGRMM